MPAEIRIGESWRVNWVKGQIESCHAMNADPIYVYSDKPQCMHSSKSTLLYAGVSSGPRSRATIFAVRRNLSALCAASTSYTSDPPIPIDHGLVMQVRLDFEIQYHRN